MGALNQTHLGPSAVAGGINTLVDPRDVAESEASYCLNWQFQAGKLLLPDTLVDFGGYLSAVGAVANPWIGLGFAKFDNANMYLMAHQKQKLYTYSGSAWANITTAAISAGTDLQPWTNTCVLNRYFACNGANELLVWDGTTLATVVSVATLTVGLANLIGRYVLGYAGRVIIGYTTEGGVAHPQRLRWCADANYLDWDTSLGTGASAVDLADSAGQIVGLGRVAGNIIVFKTDYTIIGQETGDVRDPIVFPVWRNKGCLSGQTFQSISEDAGVFLGRDNFYTIQGQTLSPIGFKVRRDLFETIAGKRRLNYGRLPQFVSWVRPELSTYYCAVVGSNDLLDSESDKAVRTYCYNYAEDLWWIEEFPTRVTAALTMEVGASAATLGSLGAATLGSITATLGSYEATAGTPTTVIGTASGSNYVIDAFQKSSWTAATVGTNTWESKDFRLNPEGFATVYRVVVHYTCTDDCPLTISLSTDRNRTFSFPASNTLITGSGKAVFRFETPVTGMHHRFKIQANYNGTTHPQLQISGMELWFRTRGPQR